MTKRTLPYILTAAVFLITSFVAPNQIPFTGSSAAFAQQEPATYEEQIAAGRDFMRRRKYEDALKAFKRANELKGQTSTEALFLMANAYMGLEAYKNVVQTCDKLIELAAGNAAQQAQAYNLKGVAIQKQSEGKDQKKLQEAESALRQAVTLQADLADAHRNLGMVLLQLNRDPEGIAELKQYVQLVPEGPSADDSRKMIDNPRRAREPFAPDFSLTTADGEYISLEDLKGKVVLLDFWGTWCPPCVASVPSLRDLNKRFAKEKLFVMISVSSDGDEDKWKGFIGAEKMVWPQYLDRDRTIQRAFRVSSFPSYILLDFEGVIRYRSSGFGFEKQGELEDAVKKQLKVVAKTAT